MGDIRFILESMSDSSSAAAGGAAGLGAGAGLGYYLHKRFGKTKTKKVVKRAPKVADPQAMRDALTKLKNMRKYYSKVR